MKAVEWRTKGSKYYLGWRDVKQDFEIAAEYYMKVAQPGHVDAQGYLGFAHQSGLGVEVDFVEALRWYKKAAA